MHVPHPQGGPCGVPLFLRRTEHTGSSAIAARARSRREEQGRSVVAPAEALFAAVPADPELAAEFAWRAVAGTAEIGLAAAGWGRGAARKLHKVVFQAEHPPEPPRQARKRLTN